MKVAIVVIVYNLDCRIFLLQIGNIKKYCTDNYTIEVIDNSTNLELSEAIKYHAGLEGVNYRKTDAGNNDPSHSHAFACNIAYQMLSDYYDYFFYLDHDCIPIKPFSVIETLGNKMIAGVESGFEYKYFWPGCLMFNNHKVEKRQIKFNPIHKMRADTGGETYKIIAKYRDQCIFFDEIGCKNPDFEDENYYFYMLICNKSFIHFIGGSNWMGLKNNDVRLNTLIQITINISNG